MGLLALLIAFLDPVPGTLFNKTVEANYDEIQGWFGRVRRGWNRLLGPSSSDRWQPFGMVGRR